MHKVHYLAVSLPGASENCRVPDCKPDLIEINGNIPSASGGEKFPFFFSFFNLHVHLSF